jgi:hypothetical protein
MVEKETHWFFLVEGVYNYGSSIFSTHVESYKSKQIQVGLL